jgi:hypothetical protein
VKLRFERGQFFFGFRDLFCDFIKGHRFQLAIIVLHCRGYCKTKDRRHYTSRCGFFWGEQWSCGTADRIDSSQNEKNRSLYVSHLLGLIV